MSVSTSERPSPELQPLINQLNVARVSLKNAKPETAYRLVVLSRIDHLLDSYLAIVKR